jgi:hypothetical protein
MRRASRAAIVAATVLAVPTLAGAAHAATLRFAYREVPDPTSIKQVDADHDHANSPGDYFQGSSFLMKGHRRVGLARFKSTIVALEGSQAQIHDEISFRLPRGHLYVDRVIAQDFNEQEHLGSKETYPISRGDGRFAGYKGKVVSVTTRVSSPTRVPIFRDTFTLTREAVR